MAETMDDARLVETLGLDRLRSLAIIGLGKNAGKTTALNHLIRACERVGLPRVVALTSIGRDGESRDLLTGGVKPRIDVAGGSLIVSSRDSITRSDPILEILNWTGIRTATGELVLARARTGGYVELAGPSSARDLTRCEQSLRVLEPDCLFLVDGALDRLSPAGGGLTEAAVLVAGMAQAGSVGDLVRATVDRVGLLTLPGLPEPAAGNIRSAIEKNDRIRALFLDGRGEVRGVFEAAILAGHGRQIAELGEAEDGILFLRGAVTDRLAEDLLATGRFGQRRLAAEDGTRFFLGRKILARLKKRGVELAVLHELRLPMVLVNPSGAHGVRVDPKVLLEAVRAAVAIPVADLGPARV